MESRGDKKPITYYARVLHRDIGYLVLGLTIVYALSGVVLIYRDTDFLKTPTYVEEALPPQMSIDDLSKKLRLRRIEVTKTEGDAVFFQEGTSLKDGMYDKSTGAVHYTTNKLPAFLERLIRLHKVSSFKTAHGFAVGYGLMLLFLALSSLLMFKPGTKPFRRGMVLSAVGVLLTVAILLFI